MDANYHFQQMPLQIYKKQKLQVSIIKSIISIFQFQPTNQLCQPASFMSLNLDFLPPFLSVIVFLIPPFYRLNFFPFPLFPSLSPSSSHTSMFFGCPPVHFSLIMQFSNSWSLASINGGVINLAITIFFSESKMAKKIKVLPPRHRFVLKGNNRTYFKQSFEADFKVVEGLATHPTYNQDNNHYTPSFINPHLYSTENTDYEAQHFLKLQGSVSKSLLEIPKPSSETEFCGVCMEYYGTKNERNAYLKHVSTKAHKKNIRGSIYWAWVAELCQKYVKKEEIDLIEYIEQEERTPQEKLVPTSAQLSVAPEIDINIYLDI